MVNFEYNNEEKTIKVIFTGRLDYMAAGELNEIIQSEPIMKNRHPEDSLIFDIGGVDYIASSFIRTCVIHAKQAGAGKFAIINCQPFVKKTFKISGLDEVLNIS